MVLLALREDLPHHLDNAILKLKAKPNVGSKIQVLDLRFVNQNLLHYAQTARVLQLGVAQVEHSQVHGVVV